MRPSEFDDVAAAFADNPRVARRRAFSTENCLTVDGKIFAMLTKAGFVVKLPRARAEELVRARAATPFEPSPGRLMKEWLVSRSEPGPGAAGWIALAREAYAFVAAPARPPSRR